MSRDADKHDLFISYARADDAGGWISGFVDGLRRQNVEFLPQGKLEIFFDRHDISSLADWQTVIYDALAHSRIFLAFVSPSYFASEWCRREWRTWIDVEIAKHILGDGMAPIYIIDVPGLYENLSEQEVARRVEALCAVHPSHGDYFAQAPPLVRQVRRRQLSAVQPFYNAGLEALRQAELRQVLEKLAADISQKSQAVKRAAESETTVPEYNRRFSGRVDELLDLRRRLTDNATGVVTGVHGLGGMGKSELAFTYAHAFASVYTGGRFLVPCEKQTNLKEAVCKLGEFFHDQISDEARKRTETHFAAIAACLRRHIHQKGHILLVLDNVTDYGLVSQDQTRELTSLGPKLHLLATTRLPARPDDNWLTLGKLPENDALALLEKFRAFASDAEKEAARAIARRLDGFAIAVEVAGAYLMAHPAITCAAFLQGLAGLAALASAEEDADVSLHLHNNEKRLSAVLEPTLASLAPPALRAMQYAALLPPDAVAVPWLEALIAQDFPDLAVETPAWEEKPAAKIMATLFNLTLLSKGGVAVRQSLSGDQSPAMEHSQLARIHRLVAEQILRKFPAPALAASLIAHIVRRAAAVYEMSGAPEPWELDALIAAAIHLLSGVSPPRELAYEAVYLVDKITIYRDLRSADALLQAVHPVLANSAAADRSNAGWQRDLAVSQNWIGNVLSAQGDLAGALNAYREYLAITQRLAESDGTNADWQRDLSVSHNKIGDVLIAQGDLGGALNAYRESLAIRQRLAESDRTNAGWQRDLSVSHNEIGNVLIAQGDLGGALNAYREDMAITQRLVESDGTNAGWQRDLSVSHDRTGNVLIAQGDLGGALNAYRESLAIAQRLAESDGTNADWQRDLSVSHNKIGNVLIAQGDLAGALNAYREGMAIVQRLAESDGTNADWQRDLSVSHNKIGDALIAQGDLGGALNAYRESLAIFQRLAESDGTNAGWQRDLSVSHDKIGDVLCAQGDLAGALNAYRESLAIRQRLAESDGTNAGWQRDLAVSLSKMAEITEQTSSEEARGWWRKAYDQLSSMKERGVMLPTDEQFLPMLREKAGL